MIEPKRCDAVGRLPGSTGQEDEQSLATPFSVGSPEDVVKGPDCTRPEAHPADIHGRRSNPVLAITTR